MSISKPHVFVASSTRAKKYAKQFSTYIKSVAQVHAWYDPGNEGDTIISFLRQEAKKCDFGVFFLTKDDSVVKNGMILAKKKPSAPRDNVTFEFGLFMGTLIDEDKRCFIIDSVSFEKDDRPTDFGGIPAVNVDLAGLALGGNLHKPFGLCFPW